jgi:hypothetical protein
MERWRTTIDLVRGRSSAAPPSAVAGPGLVAAVVGVTLLLSGTRIVTDRFAGEPAAVAVYATITHAGETVTALATPAWAPAEPVPGHRAPPLRPSADTTPTAVHDPDGVERYSPETRASGPPDSARESAAE